MGIVFDNFSLIGFVAFAIYMLLAWGLNEFGNKNLYTGLFMYLVLPLIGVFIIWPITAKGTNMDNWFSHAKVLSAAAGCLIFIALRYSSKVRSWKWFYVLPALILTINMLEAISREWEISQYVTPQTVDGMYYMGGIWNNINAIAGIFNILFISGFFGIIILSDKQKTMCWPDQIWTWVIGYDLWNVLYCYNVLGSRALFTIGISVLPVVIYHFQGKGAWIQHRAGTLAISNYIMFTFPHLLVNPDISITNAFNPVVMTILALVSLGWNVWFFAVHWRKALKNKKNPITDEINTEHSEYKKYQQLAQELGTEQ